MKRFSLNSKLCQQLLDPQYRAMYKRYANLRQNLKQKTSMLTLIADAEKTEDPAGSPAGEWIWQKVRPCRVPREGEAEAR